MLHGVPLDLAGPQGLGLLVLAGTAASVINTMAGGGGLLVLPTLLALGVPPGAANGTMRVGVLAQNVTSVLAFSRSGLGELSLVLRLLPAMALGAFGGAWAATRLSDAMLRPLFGGVLLLWAVALLVRPGRFFDPPSEPRPAGWGSQLAALAIGGYGGFLQVGVGFPLLALLVSGLGHAPVRANAIKVALVLGFTLVSLPTFAVAGQVLWREGAALAVGGVLGGWIGAAWQLRAGATVVRWFVIVTVAVSGVLMALQH